METVSSEIAFPNDSNNSGVSWGAVIAGAFVAAALSLALLALGTGSAFPRFHRGRMRARQRRRLGGLRSSGLF
jgi:hypothetical protein